MFQCRGNAQTKILAPRGRNDLHAERHRGRRRKGGGNDRQSNEGQRLSQQSHVRSNQHVASPYTHRFLSDRSRGARCGRREQHINILKCFAQALAEPAAQPLCLQIPCARHHRARGQPVAYQRVEFGAAIPEIGQMKLAAFRCGNDERRGARTLDLRQDDFSRDAECAGAAASTNLSASKGAGVMMDP